jgi:uncharacterized membrane protein required for colicin V production
MDQPKVIDGLLGAVVFAVAIAGFVYGFVLMAMR